MSIIVVVGNKSITTCYHTTAFGPLIYIDFYKINGPCFCTVTPLFHGDIFVTAQEIRISSWDTQVTVNGRCPLSQGISDSFKVHIFWSIDVHAEFSKQSSPGAFYQCLGFQQNG